MATFQTPEGKSQSSKISTAGAPEPPFLRWVQASKYQQAMQRPTITEKPVSTWKKCMAAAACFLWTRVHYVTLLHLQIGCKSPQVFQKG